MVQNDSWDKIIDLCRCVQEPGWGVVKQGILYVNKHGHVVKRNCTAFKKNSYFILFLFDKDKLNDQNAQI